jgi:DNA-binding NarL/FixJ family response regulator
MKATVLLADDQELMRMAFRMLVESQPDLEIIGEAATGRQAVALTCELAPSVVLMDVRMPEMDGVEATKQILASGSDARIIILTTFDLDEYAFSALRAGASGFLLKDVPPAELIAGVRTVAQGDAVVSPRVTRRLLEEYAHHLPDPAAPPGLPAVMDDLTERELEVLLALADGLSNAEIAQRLFLSEATVKSHVGRLLTKLGLRDRVQAVVLAFQTGLVRPTEAP